MAPNIFFLVAIEFYLVAISKPYTNTHPHTNMHMYHWRSVVGKLGYRTPTIFFFFLQMFMIVFYCTKGLFKRKKLLLQKTGFKVIAQNDKHGTPLTYIYI